MTDEVLEAAHKKFREKLEKMKDDSLKVPVEWPKEDKIAKDWESHGLRCLVLHNPTGTYNGYVLLKEGHPKYKVYYDDIDVRVHGGLTFCTLTPEGFWVGFDTAHYGDWTTYFPTGKRWTVEEVARETEYLAKQLAEMVG